MLDDLAECTPDTGFEACVVKKHQIDASVGSTRDVDGTSRADHVRPASGVFQIRNDLVRNHLISVHDFMYWLEMKKAAVKLLLKIFFVVKFGSGLRIKLSLPEIDGGYPLIGMGYCI